MRLFVKKSLGTFRLEVDVEVGDRALIVGPNGSGKSTLLKCLGGVLRCEGEAGGWLYVPPEPQLPKRLKVGEAVELFSAVLGLSSVDLEPFGVNYLGKRVGELSSGMAQRILLAIAFSTDAPLALDEPTAFLDDKWRRALAERLQERRGPVLVATHDAELISLLGWDRVVLESGAVKHVERR